MNPNSPISQSRSFSDGKRFRSALKVLEDLLKASSKPGVSLICNYNMGAIHWSSLGNGSRARELYRETVRIARSGQLPSEDATVKTILVNSCENLMLLSLSYEEYEDCSRQLRELQPKNDILRGQVPEFLHAREQGHPWSDRLQQIAHSYYNRGNAANDAGRYGCGAATWELLLTNRKALRVSREDWQDAVYEFGALAMRIVSDAMMMMEKSPQGRDLGECLFVVDPAVRFSEEFLARNPDDQRIGKLLRTLQEFRQSGCQELEQTTPSPQDVSHAKPGPNPFPALLSIAAGAGFGWAVGGLWSVLVGAVGGLLVGTCLFWLNRTTKCEQCRRSFRVGPPPPAYMNFMPQAVILDRDALESGREGMGRLCMKCGRIVCSSCNQRLPCACGSSEFRGVPLIYR